MLDARRSYRAGGQQPLAGGRLRLANALQEAAKAPYDSVPSPGLGADWIDPTAIDVPSVAGQVALTDHLLPWQRAAYLSDSLVLPECERPSLPRPCNRLHRADEGAFTSTLLGAELAGFMPEGELLHHQGRLHWA